MAFAKLIFHFVSAFNDYLLGPTSNVTTAIKDYSVSCITAFAILLYLEVLFGLVFTQGRLAQDMFLFVLQPALFKYTVCTVNVRQWQTNILLFSLSSPAHRLHGDVIVLQLHRGPAAALMGQCSEVLCPAQLPWWHCPVAGNAHVCRHLKIEAYLMSFI